LLKISFGVALTYGCIRGLMSGEGMYDSQSRHIMTSSQIIGIIIGLALIADAVIYNFIPLI
jgi:hypothetical protein